MIPSSVRPWADADPRVLRGVLGVLTDIDDTLTTEGVVTPDVIEAIGSLREAGIPTIAVTGRPMGWSRPLVASTPLEAVVAENGSVALFHEGGVETIEYEQPESLRELNAAKLRAVAEHIVREVPGATLARDSAGRVTDIAIDHAEFATLDDAAIERVVALMRAAGMTATVSSIHVNGWFGTHDKLSGARWIVQRRLGRALDAERERWVYVGDSTNDQAMFAAFPLSVGVANLATFASRLHTWPAFITAEPRGRGFVAVANALLAARRG